MFWFRWKNPIKLAIILVLCVLCYFAFTPLRQKIKLGLDLQGGLRALVELEPTEAVPQITPEILAQELYVLQSRLGGLGVSELTFEKVGNNRINIEMPGLKDPQQAIELIHQAAVLEMRPLTPEQNQRAYLSLQSADRSYAETGAYKDSAAPIITGADMTSAVAGAGPAGSGYVVNFTLSADGDKKFISGPTIQSAIGQQGQITGNFTEEQAATLANELSAGSLKVPTRIIETENVGPTLGAIDLQKSMVASLIGLAIVLLFMLAVYRLPGFLADMALVVYCFMMLAYVSVFGVVLTLPGIAGFVLSIGMAVDANVLIFERLKEELWAGRTTRAAVTVAFKRAFWTVFDSHVTTIVGALVLYWLGTGTVKGFAFTLLWGTVFSLFSAVYITRAFTDAVVDSDLVTAPAAYGA